jgi:hypothetical protein
MDLRKSGTVNKGCAVALPVNLVLAVSPAEFGCLR